MEATMKNIYGTSAQGTGYEESMAEEQAHIVEDQPVDLEVTFGDKITMLRKRKDLSQEQFAEKVMVSRAAVSKWETGLAMPGIDSLKLISQEFGVSIDELLDNTVDASKVVPPTVTPAGKTVGMVGWVCFVLGVLAAIAAAILHAFGISNGMVMSGALCLLVAGGACGLPYGYSIVGEDRTRAFTLAVVLIFAVALVAALTLALAIRMSGGA